MPNDLANLFPNKLNEKNHRITSDETPNWEMTGY